MSHLTVYPEGAPLAPDFDTDDGTQIANALRNVGVRFERWDASRQLSTKDDDNTVMKTYAPDIERLMREGGYQSVDVLRCLPDNPKKADLRAKFLSEHTHDEDEVRFFVEGAGVFYLRLAGKIFMTRCERNDLISVPPGTRHWFDMGPSPHFTVLRFFTRPDGWVARFTGDTIASRFPAFEQPTV
jgi:1,2-dihydroxy-3-keto-5-methylthiopentene dioxygenase